MQPLQPGDPVKVGRYRVGGRLGSGGMGEVFWGRSPSGRPVAIKIVHKHLASQPEFRKRFAQEVDAARRVGGFHTASVVDADPSGDPPYLVTAYVPGPSLAEALDRNGPFPVPSLRILGAGLAEALEAVHAAGLVHRDLKPANVLLTEEGPRVIDFGIARALEGGGLTATGAAIGTPRFMAPEQFGESTITGAADVWALGTVLASAAGVAPFGAGTPATVVGAIMLRPPVLDGLPGPMASIVARCLEKDPARRPTPGQLLDELSDGSPSTGWLPLPVRAMLAEHVLPDTTGPVDATNVPDDSTVRITPPGQSAARQGTAIGNQVTYQGRPPQRMQAPHHPPQAPQWQGPPPTLVGAPGLPPVQGQQPPPPQQQEPQQEPQRKRPVAAIVVAAVAIVAIVGGIVAAIALSGSSAQKPASTAAGAATSAPAGGYGTSDNPTGTGWVGNWQSVEGSTQNVAVSIDSEGASIYGISITIVDDPECGGGEAKSAAKGSPAGNEMSTSLVLSCDGGVTTTGTLDVVYTLRGQELTDDKGITYRRQ